jgi:starch-binding outer membrane protein, SusD/RagB family
MRFVIKDILRSARNINIVTLSVTLICVTLPSCKKFVEIDPPANSITTSQVFSDSADASSALLGIYTNLSNTNTNTSFGNGKMTELCGLYADELVKFTTDGSFEYYINALTPLSYNLDQIWNSPYSHVYRVNACLEGLNASELTLGVKNQFTGEAKFLRALCYFYLVNLFGDVPYITSINWQQTAIAPRTSQNEIYQNIISDLKDAQNLLRSDFSISNNERVRANKWAAAALLSRAYLYTGEWSAADLTASSIISDGGFGLSSEPGEVYFTNSSEAILQWHLNVDVFPNNLTAEGIAMIPFPGGSPNFYLSNYLLNDFESGDKRKAAWVDSIVYEGNVYYYPYKYKSGPAQYNPGAPATEYYTVLRLAEQYLIRAEARAQLNDLSGAISDVNIIRTRAGLPALPDSMNQLQVLSAIQHERRIELFAEWGHRWFDLKRTSTADEQMAVVTPTKTGGQPWQPFRKLFPIPLTELNSNPFLTQNPNY